MLFCCSGNKTIKKDHKIHIFKLTCNFLFIMSTINKHGRDWKQGLIQILQYLEILILIQKYLVLRKFLVVKERESLNILWEIAVDTLTKGFDRWELINSFFFFFFLQQTRIFLWSLFGSKYPATSLFSSQLSRNSLKIFRSYAFPLCSSCSLVVKKTGHIFVAYHNESYSGYFFPNNRQPKFNQQTWERRESWLRYSLRQLVLHKKNMTLGSRK